MCILTTSIILQCYCYQCKYPPKIYTNRLKNYRCSSFYLYLWCTELCVNFRLQGFEEFLHFKQTKFGYDEGQHFSSCLVSNSQSALTYHEVHIEFLAYKCLHLQYLIRCKCYRYQSRHFSPLCFANIFHQGISFALPRTLAFCNRFITQLEMVLTNGSRKTCSAHINMKQRLSSKDLKINQCSAAVVKD